MFGQKLFDKGNCLLLFLTVRVIKKMRESIKFRKCTHMSDLYPGVISLKITSNGSRMHEGNSLWSSSSLYRKNSAQAHTHILKMKVTFLQARRTFEEISSKQVPVYTVDTYFYWSLIKLFDVVTDYFHALSTNKLTDLATMEQFIVTQAIVLNYKVVKRANRYTQRSSSCWLHKICRCDKLVVTRYYRRFFTESQKWNFFDKNDNDEQIY